MLSYHLRKGLEPVSLRAASPRKTRNRQISELSHGLHTITFFSKSPILPIKNEAMALQNRKERHYPPLSKYYPWSAQEKIIFRNEKKMRTEQSTHLCLCCVEPRQQSHWEGDAHPKIPCPQYSSYQGNRSLNPISCLGHPWCPQEDKKQFFLGP